MVETDSSSETEKYETVLVEKKIVKEDADEKEYKDRMIIRSYSSMILLIPTFLTSVILGLVQMILNNKRGGIYTDPDVTVNTGYMNVIGVVFFIILTLNLILLAFDFDRLRSLILVIVIIAAVAVILLINVYTNFISKIITNFPDIKIYLSTQFYFLFAILLFIILLFTWVRTFFNYYVIEGNELIHHKGLGGGTERYPAANMSVKKEFPDLIEYLFFRSGTLVLAPPKIEQAIVLQNVIGINKKVKEMNEILSRLKVDIN